MSMIDLLFTNGNILTLDGKNQRAGSLAVTNGKITGIWKDPEPPKNTVHIGSSTNVVNLNGATLLPGFIDTHNHILMYGLMGNLVNCSTPPNDSITDVINTIGEKAKVTATGEWIQGYGYDDTLLYEKRHPTRSDLDKAAPNHPVLIKHISGHLAVANSLALKLAGLDDFTSDPKGGHFGRDDQNRLNGILYEPGALSIVQNQIPPFSKEQKIDALKNASDVYIKEGITTNSDAMVGSVVDLDVHLQAAKQRINPMRSQLMIMHYLLREGEIFGDYSPEELNQKLIAESGGLAKLDSAKLFQDGSIQGLTGALREPYYQHPKIYGDFIHEQEPFQEEVLDLHQRGYRLTTHGNGDRAIGSILDAYEYALAKSPRTNHRHRIEHVQAATPEDITRMDQLGVAGSFFINHVYYWGDRHERIFLGPDRARRISPLADAVKHNLLFTLHSDCPVTPISPLFSVWAAVNRKTKEGKILGPEQRIDVITALKSMTIYGAMLNFQENELGSLEIGKLADFTVLESDPTTIDPMEIKDIPVIATFIGGNPVYGQKNMVTS